jgi:hypothetical protein
VVFDVGIDQNLHRLDPGGDVTAAPRADRRLVVVLLIRRCCLFAAGTTSTGRLFFANARTLPVAVTIFTRSFGKSVSASATKRLDFQVVLMIVVKRGFRHERIEFGRRRFAPLQLAFAPASPPLATTTAAP